MRTMLFDDWNGIGRLLMAAVVGYVALVLVLRVSGKRTLSKMNAFDLVVTVALGSTFATLVLSKDVPIVEGVLAFALLVGLQFVVAWASVRSERVKRMVKSRPTLLYYRGEFLADALHRERLTVDEVFAAVRERGFGSMGGVHAIVLETAGTLSVIARSESGSEDAMANAMPAHRSS